MWPNNVLLYMICFTIYEVRIHKNKNKKTSIPNALWKLSSKETPEKEYHSASELISRQIPRHTGSHAGIAI